MRRHAPFEPIGPNICMWGGVADVINCAKFFENPSKGFGAVRPRKIALPIEIVHRPYNSVGTTVPHCDMKLYTTCNYRYRFDNDEGGQKTAQWMVALYGLLFDMPCPYTQHVI